YPFSTSSSQLSEYFSIDFRKALQQFGIFSDLMSFSEIQKRHRPQENRSSLDTGNFRFKKLVDAFSGCQLELLVILQLRHDKMVVCVEPLGHFHRRRFNAAAVG